MMAEYIIYKAEDKIAKQYLDAAHDRFLSLKDTLARMDKAGQETFFDSSDAFENNKQGLLFGDNVFLWGDNVLFDGSKGCPPPKGFVPVAQSDEKKLYTGFSLN